MKKLFFLVLLPGQILADALDPTGMTQVMSGVDDKAVSIEMGHTFPWLDQVFTHAWMSTNGFVLMYNPTTGVGLQSAPPGGFCCDGYTHATGMPTYMPRVHGIGSFSYMLAPLWTDLDDTSNDSDAGYFYKTDSDSTSFLWHKVREYATSNENTFGLTLDRTGGFKFQYEQVNVSLHHKAFVGWYGGPNFPNGDGYGGSWTQEWEMNGFTTNDVMNYGGDTQFSLDGDVASLIMSASTLNAQQGGAAQPAAPPTYAEQVADTVFGDSADDFLYLDQPDATGRPRILAQIEQQVYQDTEQEMQMFGGPDIFSREGPQGAPRVQEQQAEQTVEAEQAIVAEPARRAERAPVVEAVVETEAVTRPAVVQVRAAPAVEAEATAKERLAEPVEKAEAQAEAVAEKAVVATRPAVDVIGLAISLADQSMRQAQASAPGASSFAAEPVTVMTQNIQQAISTQSADQATNGLSVENLAPPAQVQFEQNFNDAIATGQTIGQFLSAQLPDFSQFDVTPPDASEQRTVDRAAQQLETMSQGDIDANLEDQLDTISDTGGFTDQSLAVFLLSNNPDFNQYNAVTISDRDQFYERTQVYRGNQPQVDPRALLRITGTTGYDALVDLQWQR